MLKDALLICKNSINLKELENIFIRYDFQIHRVNSIPKILKLVNNKYFQLVFIDIRLSKSFKIRTIKKLNEFQLRLDQKKSKIFYADFSDFQNIPTSDCVSVLESVNLNDLLIRISSKNNNKSRISFSIVQSQNEFRKVILLRKKVFVDREGYPLRSIISSFDKNSVHILAKISNKVIGTISVVQDSSKGLPIEQKFNISKYRTGKVIEIDKLAVLPDKHGTTIAFDLIALAYAIARFIGVQKIFIFTLKKRVKNVLFYKKFGFKVIGEFNLFDSEVAVAMQVDFNLKNTYEKKLSPVQLLQIGKKLLNMTSIGE